MKNRLRPVFFFGEAALPLMGSESHVWQSSVALAGSQVLG